MDPNTPDPNQPPAPAAPLVGTPPAAPPPAGAAPSQGGNNVMIPQTAFKKRLEQAAKSGRAAYQAELDTQAQGLGYANHAAMIQHLQGSRQQPPKPGNGRPNGQAASVVPPPSGQPPIPPKNPKDRQALERYNRDMANWQKKTQAAEQTAADERKRRRRAERERDAIQAQANLERIASGVGVKDTDYAIHLYKQHCQGKTEEELGRMDEAAFFTGLRQNHPYIFGETVVPATTGTSGAPPGSHVPPPARTAAAAGASGAGGTASVKTMNKREYNEFKAKHGYGGGSASMPVGR
jgi:hypothetical protein